MTNDEIKNYKESLASFSQPKPVETVEEDHSILGIYKIKGHYTIFDKPEHCHNSALFRVAEEPIIVVTTGKTFKSRGHILAVEIIIVQNEQTLTRWIHTSSLELISGK